MARISEPGDESRQYWCGPNDGGIKRGDRAETGDNEARPTDGVGPGGSGVSGGESGSSQGFPTADPSSEGAIDGGTGSSRIRGLDDEPESIATSEDLADLTIKPATDASLGLTDIEGVPADDWAADTGPTHSAEEGDFLAWDQLDSKTPKETTKPTTRRQR